MEATHYNAETAELAMDCLCGLMHLQGHLFEVMKWLTENWMDVGVGFLASLLYAIFPVIAGAENGGKLSDVAKHMAQDGSSLVEGFSTKKSVQSSR